MSSHHDLNQTVTREILQTELTAKLAPYATKADLKSELQSKLAPYATKADLKSELKSKLAPYATKADLSNLRRELHQDLETYNQSIAQTLLDFKQTMATKSDLAALRSVMATKADLVKIRSEMATKSDLAALRSVMATKADLAEIKARMVTKSDLTAMVEDLWGRIQAFQEELTLMGYRQSIHTDQLEKHHHRLDAIENRLKIN